MGRLGAPYAGRMIDLPLSALEVAMVQAGSRAVDEVALDPLPEPWLLSSSTAGAALAAELGLPMAFAHHIRPDNTLAALDHYRAHFSASRWCERPRVLICVETVCAETPEEAARLAGPMNVVKAGLLKGRSDVPFPTPEKASAHLFTESERQALAGFRAHQAYGNARDRREAPHRTGGRDRRGRTDAGDARLRLGRPRTVVRTRQAACHPVGRRPRHTLTHDARPTGGTGPGPGETGPCPGETAQASEKRLRSRRDRGRGSPSAAR